MSFYLAERGTAAWHEAWAALATEYGDTVCLDPASGESWQYMGTEEREPGKWTHCFRHRAYRGDRVYRHYPATPPGEVPAQEEAP